VTTPRDTQPDEVQHTDAAHEPGDPADRIKNWSASGIRITDVVVEARGLMPARGGWYIVVACAVAIVLAVVFASVSASSSAICCLSVPLGIGGAAGLCLMVFVRGSAGREARRAIREAPADQVEPALAKHLPALPGEYLHGALKHVAQAFVDSGRLGCVLRIGPAESLGRVEPLGVPFEPHLLDAIDEESQSESGEPSANAKPGQEGSYASALRDSYRPVRKWLNRYGQWVNLLVWATLGVVKSLRSGQIDFLIYALAAGLLVTLILRIHQSGLTERQAFIVPGALIVRESGWRSSNWGIAMFEPHEAVLLTCRSPDRRWELLLGSRTQIYNFRVTQAQAEAVLRAWLSPLAPPRLEQLSDLR